MNCFVVVLIFVCRISSESAPILDNCPRKMEPIGCFRDKLKERTLPIQLLNGRDKQSTVYSNEPIDWKNYHAYLQRFICRCARLAFSKGYKVIGIQLHAECWSGPHGHVNYKRHGTSNQCLTQDISKPGHAQFRKCNNNLVCTGENLANFVYRVAPTACYTYFEPVGCYHDDMKVPRPLPTLVKYDTRIEDKKWTREGIDWVNWNTYSPEMICRCAQRAKEMRMTHFGIQFYNECWVGGKNEQEIFRAGKAPAVACRAQNFEPCKYNSYSCVGMSEVNFVYRIMEG